MSDGKNRDKVVPFLRARYRSISEAKAKHPSSSSLIKRRILPGIFRGRLDPFVVESLQAFLAMTLIGVVLNYLYYDFVSLRYLFIDGVRDWFSAFQTLVDFGLGAGQNYNGIYVILNGAYYFFLFKSLLDLLYAVTKCPAPLFNGLCALVALLTAYAVITGAGGIFDKTQPTPTGINLIAGANGFNGRTADVIIDSNLIAKVLLSFLVAILWLLARVRSNKVFSSIDLVFALLIVVIFLIDWDGLLQGSSIFSKPKTHAECIVEVSNDAYNCAMNSTCSYEEEVMKGWQYCNDRCLQKDFFSGGRCE